MLRSLTLLALLVHLTSLAASQTAYGQAFMPLRWTSLFAFAGLAALAWLTEPARTVKLRAINIRVFVYLGLWALTLAAAEFPLFSAYRWIAHALIIVSTLLFMPRFLRLEDATRILTTLKILVGVILVVSYFKPAHVTIFDDPNLYRGILGNANALGHMAAVGCLLFFHGYLTGRRSVFGYVQLALAALAAVLMLRAGARSSTLALAAGFMALWVFYREQLSWRAMLAVAGIVVVVIVVPNTTAQVSKFLLKAGATAEDATLFDRLSFSRQSVWQASLEGFKERPLLGWGFGVDSDTDVTGWNGQFVSVGFTKRDAVNDFTYTLETGGIVGFAAYVFMATAILRVRMSAAWSAMVRSVAVDRQRQRLGEALEVQRAFFCLVILLYVMFEFDNTALAAGNFFSALLWTSLGLAAALYALIAYGLRRAAPPPAPDRLGAPVLAPA